MIKTKEYKTVSFRADPEMVRLLERIRKEMEKQVGLSVTVSDVLRKSLEYYDVRHLTSVSYWPDKKEEK